MKVNVWNTILQLSKERSVEPIVIVNAIKESLKVASAQYFSHNEDVNIQFTPEKGLLRVYTIKKICENPQDEAHEISLQAARNIDPTAEQLADIAIASAQNAAKLLGEQARIALLSFSAKGSASSPSVDKVCMALEITKKRTPDITIDGEFQADTAIVANVAAKKVKGQSDVAGNANVLIFPDLNSGNIAYKLTQYLAGAKAIGPFLQGFAKPLSDLSRGATVDDIVSTAVITLAQIKS